MATSQNFTGTVQIEGTDYPVVFNPSAAEFRALIEGPGGGYVTADTFDQLNSRMRAVLARRKVEVAVRFVEAGTGRHGTATGLDPRDPRKVKVRWAGERLVPDFVGAAMRPDVDAEEHKRLHRAMQDASRDFNRFVQTNSVGPNGRTDLAVVVREAIDEAALKFVSEQ